MSSILVIPSAKYISERLQSIGLLPPIIYPLQDGIVLDKILHQFTKVDHILLVLGEGADNVIQRLNQPKYESIHVMTINTIGSLNDTIFNALEYIKESTDFLTGNDRIIINFGDTIVENLEVIDDSFIFSTAMYSNKWTFFEKSNGSMVIIDRPQPELKKGSIFVGVFVFSDFNLLLKCVSSQENFFNAISEYDSIIRLNPISSDYWFDIGHMDKYQESKRRVQERTFNHISIDMKRGILTKKSEDKEKFIREIQWYLKLPADIEYCRPRIFSYSLSYDNPCVKMEYYPYHTIHELFIYGELSLEQWFEIISQIHFIYCDLSKYTIKEGGIKESLTQMYLDKTIKRLNLVIDQKTFEQFADHIITVNGKKYPSLRALERILSDIIPKILFKIDHFQIIHGDLCFPNILIDDNYKIVKLIDPRGSFGKYDIYGDGRYDIAKLLHSIEGKYDYIIKDLFSLEFDLDECIINYSINKPTTNIDLLMIMRSIFGKEMTENEKEIQLIESLLFLTMIPLHYENKKHQIIMLGTGLELLSKVIDLEKVN